MNTYFPLVQSTIKYEGPHSRDPLSFKWFNPQQKVRGKTMAKHFRFAVSYWHTLKGGGSDMFGPAAWVREWNSGSPMEAAEKSLHANFEFCQKLGVPYYCFHDRDIAPEGSTFAESVKNLQTVVKQAKQLQQDTGIKLLWGTANLFSNPRYTHGAGTNPDLQVFAYAAAQLKHALEATAELGGENYVFWGGREGYETLLNTNYGQEQRQFAALLRLAVEHAKSIGFKGQFLIEPKPREPSTHQYDSDSAACLNFLREYGLLKHFKLNLETNHATLAGHTMEHEMEVAMGANALGSVDANRGDTLLGWDTDQFPTDLYLTTNIMLRILKMGGFTKGGLNFDAKRRRESHEPVDLFHAHIGGMDAFARGLKIAAAMRADGAIQKLVEERYATWSGPLGKRIEAGTESFASLEKEMLAKGEAQTNISGRQELFENVINTYL